MPAPFRFVPNRQGIATFLKAPETLEVVKAKLRAIEAAAGLEQSRVDWAVGGDRVRGAVIGDYKPGTPREESRRKLLHGIDGAQGSS